MDQQRGTLLEALAKNDWVRHLQETRQDPLAETFNYKGETLDTRLGQALMQQEQQHFLANERWMPPAESRQAVSDLQLSSLDSRKSPLTLNGGVQKQAWVSPHYPDTYILDDTGTMTWQQLVNDWFFEKGDAARSFDASHPITQDLMKDEGVRQARAKWEGANRPKGGNYPYSFNVPEYARELFTLDGTGSTLGSYNVFLEEVPDGRVRYDVYNNTGWESGTRMPRQIGTRKDPSIEDLLKGNQTFDGRIKSILNNPEREEDGPGGLFRQHYFWYE